MTLTTFVRNVGTESVEMASDDPLLMFNIRIEDPEGRPLPMTHFGRRRFEEALRWGGSIAYTLAPGQQRHQTIRLDGMYDLSLPGRYSLTVSRSPMLLGTGGPLVTSNLASFVVGTTHADKVEPVEAPKPRRPGRRGMTNQR